MSMFNLSPQNSGGVGFRLDSSNFLPELSSGFGSTGSMAPQINNIANVAKPEFSWFSPNTWNDALRSNGVLSSIDEKTGQKLDGWGGLALSAGQGLLNAYMGMKQYGLVKDQFNFQKNAWNKEFEVNKNLTNSRLEDRQNRRNAEAGNMAAWGWGASKPQDTASYMARYGVK